MPSVIPPEFTEGAEVICTYQVSEFHGQRGVIYGRGMHPRRRTEPVFYVQWSSGARHQYRISSLALAPKMEHLYRVANMHANNIQRQVHEVPASSRGLPTIFERVTSVTSDNE